MCQGAVNGVLVALLVFPSLLWTSLLSTPEVFHQSIRILWSKSPADIAVGSEADYYNNQDEEGVKDVAFESGDVTKDAGVNLRLSETTSILPLGLRLRSHW
uniref:Uncharacterized protein n=1 Tax=Peronospora matthiolae TaxID=2874970 RepID=A0AAV1VB35_9STRA